MFTGNCPLCREVLVELEVGKCRGCELIERPMSTSVDAAREYGVQVVPTIIIDGVIRIEGRPDIPLVCSTETYEYLNSKYRFR